MIVASNLVKKYGTKKAAVIAVKGLSFSVNKGEIFGIIGPDGAGKTSLFRMLLSLLLPDGGSAMVNGYDVVKDYKLLRKVVGYMPGRFSLYQDLTVEENLRFFATIFNTTIEENYSLIKEIYVQIAPFKNRRAGKLSGGMKQKLALCCALIHRPVVLFLDEPTTGVDAVSRMEFWQMLQRLKEQDITILVSTPYMDEAGLCNRVALMQDGNFLTTGTPAEIVAGFGNKLIAVKTNNMHQLVNDLQQIPGIDNAYAFGEFAHAVILNGSNDINLQNALLSKGHTGVITKTIEPDIEDCFLKLMR